MNFFAQQERARSHTKRMLFLFVLAVAAIVFAVDLVIVIAFGTVGRHGNPANAIGALIGRASCRERV